MAHYLKRVAEMLVVQTMFVLPLLNMLWLLWVHAKAILITLN
jgi:hypothetical protein